MTTRITTRILVIAGSDSSGGAGIQADIKTITALGGYAMTAVTAVTAQNTLGVEAVHVVPTDIVMTQIETVIADLGVDAIKIGMIGSAETANALAAWIAQERAQEQPGHALPIVFDPVMVATSGGRLADPETIAAFGKLMDVATIATPNLPELAALVGAVGVRDDPVAAALGLVSAHRCAVMIKGGHEDGDAIVDALIEEDNMTSWQSTRIETRQNHGTGCTLASAMAVFLAQGDELAVAVERARDFVRLALLSAPGLGQGSGPMGQGALMGDAGPSMRLNQVTVKCSDYAASVEFYRALGLKQIVDSDAKYARFEVPGGATFSISLDEAQGAPGATTVYFESNDLDDQVNRLGRAGLRFEHGPVDQPYLWREARLRDPYGNLICLYQAGEMRRFPPWRISDA